MNLLLADWRRAGRIDGATVAAAVVPVWSRTLGEFRTSFETGGGSFAGLELDSIELFRLDNPYRHDNPAVFARDYVQSVTAWGGPLLLRAFAREGEARAAALLADFLGELEERVGRPPTAIAGTTSRLSSSAGKLATRGDAAPASPRPVDVHVLVRCLLGDLSLSSGKTCVRTSTGSDTTF